jgi:hypothetical protein
MSIILYVIFAIITYFGYNPSTKIEMFCWFIACFTFYSGLTLVDIKYILKNKK